MNNSGPHNDITDVSGIRIGQAHDMKVRTGVTVIKPDMPCVCAVDVRGGGPGTRETDALDPATLVDAINAVVLSGGSVYGLAAADAVATILGAQGEGFSLVPREGVPPSPIVPSAILYDLANGGDKAWGETPPYHDLGRKALASIGKPMVQGSVGAGCGAIAGAYQGGIGSASYITDDGFEVGAIAAVNSFGSPYMPMLNAKGERVFWSAPYEMGHEFGGVDMPKNIPAHGLPPDTKVGAPAGANTTICAVAVNATLTQADAKRFAIMAQDGLARAIRPVHAPTDGDVVFALATGAKETPEPRTFLLTRLGSIAADCLARAVARSVYEAS